MALAIPADQQHVLSPSAFLLRKTNSVPNICIHLDFSPNCTASPSPLAPSFNPDRKHFTPCFILPCDKVPMGLSSPVTRITGSCTWRCTFESGSSCNNKNQF